MKYRLLLIALITSIVSFGQQPDDCFQELENLIQLSESAKTFRPKNWDNASTTVEINYVFDERYNYADSILNTVYLELHETLDCLIVEHDYYYGILSAMKSDITEGQRAWITIRNSNASFESLLAFGGSIEDQWYMVESTQATIKRTEKLISMISQLKDALSR